MKVACGWDHRGRRFRQVVEEMVKEMGHEFVDLGAQTDESSDYPDFAFRVGEAVREGGVDRGVLVCGTGIGMSIAANKVAGVRAAVVHDEATARLSREHNDANVLCLSGDLVGQTMMRKIVETWLTTEFEAGRHQRRVRKIQAIEEGTDPREITTTE